MLKALQEKGHFIEKKKEVAIILPAPHISSDPPGGWGHRSWAMFMKFF